MRNNRNNFVCVFFYVYLNGEELTPLEVRSGILSEGVKLFKHSFYTKYIEHLKGRGDTEKMSTILK